MDRFERIKKKDSTPEHSSFILDIPLIVFLLPQQHYLGLVRAVKVYAHYRFMLTYCHGERNHPCYLNSYFSILVSMYS
jgi:hypothetical protein